MRIRLQAAVFKEVASQEYYNIPGASFKYCENYREISLTPLLASDKLATDAEIEWKILLLYCYRREGSSLKLRSEGMKK